jgi:hypothetical protein
MDLAFAKPFTSSQMTLVPGRRYRVVQTFRDFDDLPHAAPESWIFLGHNFVPYHDGLSLFVQVEGAGERSIRLQWTPDEQGPLIDNLAQYLIEA